MAADPPGEGEGGQGQQVRGIGQDARMARHQGPGLGCGLRARFRGLDGREEGSRQQDGRGVGPAAQEEGQEGRGDEEAGDVAQLAGDEAGPGLLEQMVVDQ
ncbi:hypothetical protein [Nonomuraea dietziae]|uniref:hypothetical protein n=1 Tax=Nonomuraea dietziae TaxID=65515 RepID=UPI0033E4B44C